MNENKSFVDVESLLSSITDPLLEWYAKEARVLPWRMDSDPYHIWVSEIMLQQTRVDTVIPYYERFISDLPTIEKLADATEEQILKLWEGLGYYSRVRNMWRAAKIICEQYGGRFPEDYKQILELPGIGSYTAGAISSIAFNMPKAAVDGNVLRVVTRVIEDATDISSIAFRKWINDELEKVYPANKCCTFTQSLMELGAMICVPNGFPKCEMCPISSVCRAYANNTQMNYPVKQKKMERKKVKKTVFLLCYQDQIVIQKRLNSGLLGGMWEFPNEDSVMSLVQVGQWLKERGIIYSKILREPDSKHIFTHVEWEMSAYLVICNDSSGEFTWITRNDLDEKIALPTAFKKLYAKCHWQDLIRNEIDQ